MHDLQPSITCQAVVWDSSCSRLMICDSVQDSFSTAISPLGASSAAPYGVYGNPSLGFGATPNQASPLGYGSSPGAGPSPVLAGGQIPIYRPSSQVRAAEMSLAGSMKLTAGIQPLKSAAWLHMNALPLFSSAGLYPTR